MSLAAILDAHDVVMVVSNKAQLHTYTRRKIFLARIRSVPESAGPKNSQQTVSSGELQTQDHFESE
jgi:hypothetical protein